MRYLHSRMRQGVFQNAAVSNRQHSGVGYNTPTTVMHETQTAAMAETHWRHDWLYCEMGSSFYYQISCGELKQCLSSCPLICYLVPSCPSPPSILSQIVTSNFIRTINYRLIVNGLTVRGGKNGEKIRNMIFASMGNDRKKKKKHFTTVSRCPSLGDINTHTHTPPPPEKSRSLQATQQIFA